MEKQGFLGNSKSTGLGAGAGGVGGQHGSPALGGVPTASEACSGATSLRPGTAGPAPARAEGIAPAVADPLPTERLNWSISRRAGALEAWGRSCGVLGALACHRLLPRTPPHPLPLTLSRELLRCVLWPGGGSGAEAILVLPGSCALRRQPLRMCRSARHCTPLKKELQEGAGECQGHTSPVAGAAGKAQSWAPPDWLHTGTTWDSKRYRGPLGPHP